MNLEKEYRDCIKSRRDKIGIARHIIDAPSAIYIVQLPNEEDDMHIIAIALGASMICQSCLFCFLYNPFLNCNFYLLVIHIRSRLCYDVTLVEFMSFC